MKIQRSKDDSRKGSQPLGRTKARAAVPPRENTGQSAGLAKHGWMAADGANNVTAVESHGRDTGPRGRRTGQPHGDVPAHRWTTPWPSAPGGVCAQRSRSRAAGATGRPRLGGRRGSSAAKEAGAVTDKNQSVTQETGRRPTVIGHQTSVRGDAHHHTHTPAWLRAPCAHTSTNRSSSSR